MNLEAAVSELSELQLVDRESAIPLHVQVRRRIVEMIRSAPADATTPLPTEAELMSLFGVSRITVRRAMSDLAAAGYIHRQAGRGSFALPRKLRHTSGRIGGASDEFREQGFDVKAEVLAIDDRVPPSEIAVLFGIQEDSPVQYASRVLYVDDKPISVVRMYFNLPPGARLSKEDLERESFLGVLRSRWNIVPARATRTIEATLATEEDSRLLKLDLPAAVLIVDLIGYGASGQAVFHINVRYDSAYYKYVQEIPGRSEA